MTLTRKSVLRRVLLALLAVLAVGSAQAATLRVPQDYPTIQGALNATTTGDEVVVSPGLYNENVWIDRQVVLRSTFDGHDWSIVENTIIKAPETSIPAVQGGGGSMVPLVRGFHITRAPIPPPTTFSVWAVGISGNLNIEYNIIENQLSMDPINRSTYGGAIVNNTGGTIQNNIIHNNRSDTGAAFCNCGQGIIRNNVIYGNISSNSLVVSCSSDIINNTFYGNHTGVAIGNCAGKIVNNIVWETLAYKGHGVPIASSSTPNHCMLQGYTGPGVGNIDADPKFVNPAKGDFHLRPDSPAIDNGISTGGLTIDLEGNARGKVWHTQGTLGDGSHTDIGAYEFQPQPLTLWFPSDVPSGPTARDLEVDWALQPEAGQTITLELCQGTQSLASFGSFTAVGPLPTADCPATATLHLPSSLPLGADYFIRGRSALDGKLSYDSTLFGVPAFNGVPAAAWTHYR